MENVLLILPKKWKLNKIRYLQGDVEAPCLLNMDLIDTPIDSQFSWFNQPMYTLKKDGPTGFKALIDD